VANTNWFQNLLSRESVPVIAAILLLLLSYGPHLCHSFDDAFITYRYARNLAQGDGLVFNPGVQILGTTAPGWAVILSVCGIALGSEVIPCISGFLALAALVGSAWLVAGLVKVTERRSDTFVPLVILLACNRWLIEILGHEEFAVTLLVLLGLELIQQKKPTVSGIVWSAGIFIRPDTAVMGAAVGLEEWYRARRFPGALFISAVLGTVLAALFVFTLSGHILPSSLAVKKAEATIPILAVNSGFWHQLWNWSWRTWGWGGPFIAIFTAAGYSWLLRNRLERTLKIIIPAAAITVLYPLIGVPFAPWYLVYPVFCVLFGLAVFLARAFRTQGWVVRTSIAIAVFISLLPQMSWTIEHRRVAPDPRKGHMEAAARWIDDHPEPEGSIAVVEAGFLGWASERPILDLMGLNSPGALQALTVQQIPRFFLAEGPAYFVFNTNFQYIFDDLLKHPEFLDRYEVVHTIPPTSRHVVPVQIWQRKEQPPTE
jgi:hypothetical protein